jgi:hypothetical protein
LPLLLCMVLILPPLELPNRIFAAGFVSVVKTGVEIKDPDGTTLTIPEGAVASGSSVKLSSESQQAFASSPLAQTLPAYLDVKSPLYLFVVQGERPKQAMLSLPIPNDSEPYTTLDLYAQYGQQWFKIPFNLNEQDLRLESDLNFVPDAVFIAQTKPQAPLIDAMLTRNNSLPEDASRVLVEVNPGGLRLADQGSIAGDVMSLPETSAYSTYAIVPTVTNVDDSGPRTDLAENMLNDPAQRTAHINLLVDLAVQKLYSGYNLDYKGLAPEDQNAFTAFVKELASALHDKQKILSVTLPLPKPVSQDLWDTAGYDWVLIGRYADEVKIPVLPDLHAYEGDTPLVGQYLQWAVGQIDRYKLQLAMSMLGRDESGAQFSPVSYLNALKLIGPISIPQQVHPGETVTFELPKLRAAGGIQHHLPSGLFYFNYKDDNGAPHTVWLENADSLAINIALLLKYNMHGVALQDLDTKLGMDPRVWPVLDQFRSLQPSTLQTNLSVVWLVDGKLVGTSSASDPRFNWTAPSDSGQHSVDVSLSVDDGKSYASGGQAQALVIQPQPTPVVPTPRPTLVPTEVPAGAPPSGPPPAKPTAKPPAPPSVPAGGNFTGTNMFGYGAQLNWTSSPIGNDGEFSTLNSMGFGWAKIQVRWCDLEGSPGSANLTSLDNITAVAKAHNIKLLFSVVCGPSWTGATVSGGNPGPGDDPNQLGNFLNGIAGKYCSSGLGAIEVWNETNLTREWGTRPLNGADYMNFLKVAYTRVKQACPSMIVVSGAPTPTGGDGGKTAVQDSDYLQQMYSAGLAQYSDAIGIHPSGYNVPVDCDVTNPSCVEPTGINFKGPWEGGGAHHYSWSFLSMMNKYRSIMLANGDRGKQLWATEFGWGVTPTPFPGYEFERDNTSDEQAQWLVKAYQFGKSWGWVGVMFTWNLDFTSGENAAFAILGHPAQGTLTSMPK